MRPDSARRWTAAPRSVLLALVPIAVACARLSYPEPAPGEGEGEGGPQTHVATLPDASAWVALSRSGRNAMRVRDLAAAEESYVAALAETAMFPIHDARVRTALGNVLRVAAAHQAAGDYNASGRLIGHVVRSADSGRLADFEAAAPIFSVQASHLERSGDRDGAIALYETGLGLHRATDPALVLPRIEMQSQLGNAYLDVDRPDEAAPLLLLVLQAVQSRFGPDSHQASRAMFDVGAMRAARGDFAGAERDFLRALAIQEREIAGSLEHALNENRLAWLYLEHDRVTDAARHAGASVALLDALGAGGPVVIASLDTLATAEARQGQLAEAEFHYARALALYDETLPESRSELVELLDHYADLARSRGDSARADSLAARATRDRATLSALGE